MTTAAWPTSSESTAAAGAVGGLVLAAIAQLISQSRGVDAVVLAGYAAAAVVFAVTARQVPPADAGWALRPRLRLDRVQAVGTLVGVAAAVLLAALAHSTVYRSLVEARASVAGPLLWAASLAALLGTALIARPLPTWPAAWRAEIWPSTRQGRRVLVVLVAVFLVVGACARLIALGSVPLGINADEGDRAGSAISLLEGDAPWNIFASGWFYISNVYFSLLALVMKVFGIGYVQARLLGAVSGWLTLCVVVWIGFRHFGHRVALLTAVLGSVLAVMLQFSRETTEAAPTTLCWALGIAFLLEAGRTGGTWSWVAAGIAGGASLYFYPSGRLWLVLAALVCLYLVVWIGRGRRLVAIAGAGTTALATLVTLGPFLANVRLHPGELTLRARQVSAFYGDNATRLDYYDPDWNSVQLLWAQVTHSVALFANTGDGGGFWPTGRPILGGVLTVLVAVGVGWFTLSWRSVPRFTLALWFWVGVAGMVVTVETPNLQRMATAVPVLPLLAAGVLDSTVARVRRWAHAAAPEWDAGGLVLGGAAVLVALGLAVQQARFYFVTYADMDGWPQPTVQGEAVADQRGALVMTLGRASHQINAGWVRLLAPNVERASVPSPGTQLPLALPAARDLAFVLYPDQASYLPFLREVYPGGTVSDYRHSREGLIVTVYRVPRERVAARRGSVVVAPNGRAARVAHLGALPPGTRPLEPLRWSALVRVPQYWNYSLRVGPGPARLSIGGKRVLTVPAGQTRVTVTLALARGRHLFTLEGVASRARPPTVEWMIPARGQDHGPEGFERWRTIATADLSAERGARGLVAAVTGGGMDEQRRLDGAIATCCFSDEVHAGRPYTARWNGTLNAPRTGAYVLRLAAQGAVTLRIDRKTVIRTEDRESVSAVPIQLRAGRHTIRITFRVAVGPGGLELGWVQPGGRQSIVPQSALAPAPGAGTSPPVDVRSLGVQPSDKPLVLRK